VQPLWTDVFWRGNGRPETDCIFCFDRGVELPGRAHTENVRYRAGTNLVLLESDVQAAFPDAEAVNEALRMLLKVARRQVQEKV
jgi:hypothetical protein